MHIIYRNRTGNSFVYRTLRVLISHSCAFKHVMRKRTFFWQYHHVQHVVGIWPKVSYFCKQYPLKVPKATHSFCTYGTYVCTYRLDLSTGDCPNRRLTLTRALTYSVAIIYNLELHSTRIRLLHSQTHLKDINLFPHIVIIWITR